MFHSLLLISEQATQLFIRDLPGHYYPTALTELGTIPAFACPGCWVPGLPGLACESCTPVLHVVDCRHSDVRSGAGLGGVFFSKLLFLVYGLEEGIVTSPRSYARI
ncbi:MAG TPA: hypothetical protein VFR47_09395 [Anaerolineales bacterium]|nr:hypothetical protein [Anaerolineales bacterium]